MIDLASTGMAIKPKADSTLYNMKKADLIEYIRCLENNYNTAVWFNENQARYIESLNLPTWISCAERLPDCEWGAECPEPVIYKMKATGTVYAGYYGTGSVWRDRYFRQYGTSSVDVDDVSCWMYQSALPQPPNGDTDET